MEQSTRNDEIEIDLRELFAVLLRKAWIILLAGVGLAIVALLISKFVIRPQYISTTKVYVMNRQDSNAVITYSDLQSGAQLTQDYMTLITSRPVTEQVIAELGLDMKHKDMVDIISVDNPKNTRTLTISVEYNDPYMAKEIADAIRKASTVHITNVMDIDAVNVVEEANVPDEPSSPNIKKNTVMCGAIGVALAMIVISIIYILDDTIKTPEDVEKYLGLSVLSSIPVQEDMNNLSKRKREKKVKAKQKSNEKYNQHGR